MRRVDMYFDYECPYCKKGFEDLLDILEELGDKNDLHMVWRPCEAHPRPENHPPHTDLAIQGYFLALSEKIDIMAYHKRMFDAVHTDRIDVEDPETLAEYLDPVLPKEKLLPVLEEGVYRQAQERNNRLAYEENEVWYLPAFRLDGKKLDAEGGKGVTREDLKAFLEPDA